MEKLLRGMDEPAARGLTLTGRPLPEFSEPIRSPHGTTPARRPASVRRTMSIDVHWPEGLTHAGHYHGRARDAATHASDAPPLVLSEAWIEVTAEMRQLLSISAEPSPPRLHELVGVRAGGYLRSALNDAVPEEKKAGSVLYLLLDDLAGTTLVSNWALSRWSEEWLDIMRQNSRLPVMQGVCIGFRPGSLALDEEGRSRREQNTCKVLPLRNSVDPLGWHSLPDFAGVNFRRARRIDVWRQGDDLKVESHFQDSARQSHEGDRWAVHEYLIQATVGGDGRLRQIEAIPGTLPYAACRSAPANLDVLLGTPVRDLRDEVLERLKFTGGCTHLNDMARSLAEVPVLAAALP